MQKTQEHFSAKEKYPKETTPECRLLLALLVFTGLFPTNALMLGAA
jgi:hypothetical protein